MVQPRKLRSISSALSYWSRPRCEGEEHGPSPLGGAPMKGSGVELGCELGINQSIAEVH